MAFSGTDHRLTLCAYFLGVLLVTVANCTDIFLEWHVAIDASIRPVQADQPVSMVACMETSCVFFYCSEVYVFVIFGFRLLPSMEGFQGP